MIDKIILSVITFLVSGILGFITSFLTSKIKRYKNQDEALKCLLRSNITSKYYVYKQFGEIPEYEKRNINYLAEAYYNMNGNSYVKEIVSEINKMKVK